MNERNPTGTVRLRGAEIKKEEGFKYFGSRAMESVRCDKKVSATMKGKVYKMMMRPAILYGLEIFVWFGTEEKTGCRVWR